MYFKQLQLKQKWDGREVDERRFLIPLGDFGSSDGRCSLLPSVPLSPPLALPWAAEERQEPLWKQKERRRAIWSVWKEREQLQAPESPLWTIRVGLQSRPKVWTSRSFAYLVTDFHTASVSGALLSRGVWRKGPWAGLPWNSSLQYVIFKNRLSNTMQ